MLNGEGDTIQITDEQVESLKAELDWFASVGNSALREDIQKEQQRLPLDAFVGMTMSEALDFINSTWTPDSNVEKTLVPNSDGKWAYYVHQGIYLEYPVNYSLQRSTSEKDYIYFIPYQGSPDQWHPNVMKVHIWNVPASEKDITNPSSWYSHENVLWERAVQNAEFTGVEFISRRLNSSCIDFHAFLFNQERGLAVDVQVLVIGGRQFPNDFDYSAMVDQEYEYFQHMVDTIGLDLSPRSEQPIQLTSTPDMILQTTPTPYLVTDPTLISP